MTTTQTERQRAALQIRDAYSKLPDVQPGRKTRRVSKHNKLTTELTGRELGSIIFWKSLYALAIIFIGVPVALGTLYLVLVIGLYAVLERVQ